MMRKINWNKLTNDEKNHLIHKEVFGDTPCDKWDYWHVAVDEMVKGECGHTNCYPAKRPTNFVGSLNAAFWIIKDFRKLGYGISLFSGSKGWGWDLEIIKPHNVKDGINPEFVISSRHENLCAVICMVALKNKGFEIEQSE